MTATPIPRTLVLTYYGDMDVSRLTEKPAGRRPIETRAVPLDRLDEVVERIRAATAERRQGLLGLPAGRGIRGARRGRGRGALHARSPPPSAPIVGLVARPHEAGGTRRGHGRASSPARSRVLVATTVVEVGVDVPDATIMVIEHAERFGLAQLHQLRGRVGRSDRPSTCLLLYKAPLGAIARDRLGIMRETEDGFRIAEEDLRLRGGGEILGTRQSGTPGFRIAQPEHQAELMEIARDDARLVVDTDPDLESRARRSAPRPALSLRPRRGDPAAAGRLTSRRRARGRASAPRARRVLARYSGVTSPAEMTSLAASSTRHVEDDHVALA